MVSMPCWRASRAGRKHRVGRLLSHHHALIRSNCSAQLVSAGQGEPMPAGVLLELAEAITELQAQTAKACDPRHSAELIGCHGQTVWHRPPAREQKGCRAEGPAGRCCRPLCWPMLQRPVVHDFRAADLALGGQGAPLVPMADAALMGRIEGWRALLNLGGIANITLIPPSRGPERGQPVLGWDCGPANSLIDLAISHFSGGRDQFDRGGAWAAQGCADDGMIERWLQEAYFQKSPPKSTGRELFGREDLTRRLHDLSHCSAEDQIATLTAFTAAVVAQDLHNLRTHGRSLPVEMVVAGGGSQNPTLMHQLRIRCRGLRVRPSDELNLPSQSREALVFALLAWWHACRHPGNAPAVTGAERACVLGLRADPR